MRHRTHRKAPPLLRRLEALATAHPAQQVRMLRRDWIRPVTRLLLCAGVSAWDVSSALLAEAEDFERVRHATDPLKELER